MLLKAFVQSMANACGYEFRRTPRRWVHPRVAKDMSKPKPEPGAIDPYGMLPPCEPATGLLPRVNADGRAILGMTDEQRYLFDLRGWLVLPGLLDAEELAAVRGHVQQFRHRWDTLAPSDRFECAGPAQILLDHPAVVGVLNEVLSYQPLATESCYGFRYDGSFVRSSRAGDSGFDPHSGAGMYAFVGNSHIYQNVPGRVHAGLTRVVWELNDVCAGDGGTLLLSGSHKAAFPRPAAANRVDCPWYDSYACPAGSAVIFSESIVHSYDSVWNSAERERLAVFICFNTVNSKWHRGGPSPTVVEALTAKRQTLFRGAWVDHSDGRLMNTYYSPENHAI